MAHTPPPVSKSAPKGPRSATQAIDPQKLDWRGVILLVGIKKIYRGVQHAEEGQALEIRRECERALRLIGEGR